MFSSQFPQNTSLKEKRSSKEKQKQCPLGFIMSVEVKYMTKIPQRMWGWLNVIMLF